MPLEPIDPRRLYHQIAKQLRRLIEAGEYPVGSRLPAERTLADKLRVSRPTVREALIALEVEGRVRIRVGSGIHVISQRATLVDTARPEEGPLEVLCARAFLEGAVAQEAARCPSERAIAKLDALLVQTKRIPLTQKSLLALDRRFHVAIVSMLNNPVLTRMVRELFDQRNNPYLEKVTDRTEDVSSFEASRHEHEAIRDAIAAGSPERARAAMDNHLRLSQERYFRAFGEPACGDKLFQRTPSSTLRMSNLRMSKSDRVKGMTKDLPKVAIR